MTTNQTFRKFSICPSQNILSLEGREHQSYRENALHAHGRVLEFDWLFKTCC
jgi:hypothetical protein